MIREDKKIYLFNFWVLNFKRVFLKKLFFHSQDDNSKHLYYFWIISLFIFSDYFSQYCVNQFFLFLRNNIFINT